MKFFKKNKIGYSIYLDIMKIYNKQLINFEKKLDIYFSNKDKNTIEYEKQLEKDILQMTCSLYTCVFDDVLEFYKNNNFEYYNKIVNFIDNINPEQYGFTLDENGFPLILLGTLYIICLHAIFGYTSNSQLDLSRTMNYCQADDIKNILAKIYNKYNFSNY